MARGTEHEPDAIGYFEAVSGELATRTGVYQLWTPWEDWAGCTTDGLVGEDGIVEAKCPWEVPSEPKEAWWVQLQSQLHITGRSVGYLSAWSPDVACLWRTVRCEDYWPIAEPLLKGYWEMLRQPTKPGRTKKPKLEFKMEWTEIR
jgi:hypothetical protein